MRKFYICFVICLATCGLIASSSPALSKTIKGFQGIELGMNRAEALHAVQGIDARNIVNSGGGEISVLVRNSRLFRHAHYRFNRKGVLTEIDLAIREVLGKDKVLDALQKSYGMRLNREGSAVVDGVQISVTGNTISLKLADLSAVRASSKVGLGVK